MIKPKKSFYSNNKNLRKVPDSTQEDLRFYLAGDMTNPYRHIQGSLEWPFSELFSANVSL